MYSSRHIIQAVVCPDLGSCSFLYALMYVRTHTDAHRTYMRITPICTSVRMCSRALQILGKSGKFLSYPRRTVGAISHSSVVFLALGRPLNRTYAVVVLRRGLRILRRATNYGLPRKPTSCRMVKTLTCCNLPKTTFFLFFIF